MVRMLFLRDIDGDVHIGCRACGHEGRLARADLLRRFGPSYPVLSLAPHFRCSRCNSRDTESRAIVEAPPDAPVQPAGEGMETALAALRGFASAVRGASAEADDGRPPAAEPWTADAMLKSMMEDLDAPRDAEPDDADDVGDDGGDDRGDDRDVDGDSPAQALAALRGLMGDATGPGDAGDGDADGADADDADDGDAPSLDADTPEAFFRGLGRQAGAPGDGAAGDEARGRAGWPATTTTDDDDDADRFAALRALTGPGDQDGDSDRPDAAARWDDDAPAFAIRDREAHPLGDDEDDEEPLDLVDRVPDDGPDHAPDRSARAAADAEEFSDDEILDFALGDRATAASRDDRPNLFEETLANLRNLVADDRPPPEPEPPAETDAPEPAAPADPDGDAPDDVVAQDAARHEDGPEEDGPEEDAAADSAPADAAPPPGPSPARDAERAGAPAGRPSPGSMQASLAALREAVEKAAAEDDAPPRPRRAPAAKPRAPERPFSETLAALRGMLDLDREAGKDGGGDDTPNR